MKFVQLTAWNGKLMALDVDGQVWMYDESDDMWFPVNMNSYAD